MHLVGLDLGTSAVKAGLFDEAGRLLRLARRSYPLYTPNPGWAEHDPEEWWQAVCNALREVLGSRKAKPVVALGLSGQTPGHVLVTGDGTALGRAIGWSDRRAIAEAAWIAARISAEQAEAWTGHPFVSGATQPPARLRWLQVHRAEDWRRCAAVLQPKDYIALRLTGRIATDRNSSFCLAHAETGQYHPTYLAMLELEPEKMPPALPPTAVVGTVTSLAASATDLPMGTPVAIGTIDAWCDILGCGGVVSGCAVDVAGTSEVVALVSDRPVDGDGVFGQALTDGLYWIGGPMQMGGAALEWLADGFYGGPAAIPQLEAEAATVPPGAEGLLFLPYLRGERAPVWDDAARGAFVGLTDRHSRAHFARAVYEGVAFAVWDLLQRCLAATGTHPAVLRVSGGGARSALWNQIKADVTALPVQPMAVLDGACLGAAMLAAVAVGAFPGLADAAAAMAHPAAAFAPRAEPVARYQSLFPLWRALYPRLRPTFAGISQAGAGPPRIHGQPSTGPQGRARSGGR